MSRRSLFSPLISSVAAILILAAGCSDRTPTTAQLETSYDAVLLPEAGLTPSFSRSGSASRVIGPEGGEIKAGRITISFPAGALSQPTEISVAPDPKKLAVTFGPHGTQFPAGAEPTLTFNYAGIANLPERDLTVYYVSNSGVVLEKLTASVDTDAKTVTVKPGHFSNYAVATP
jgi:hypothetical protein